MRPYLFHSPFPLSSYGALYALGFLHLVFGLYFRLRGARTLRDRPLDPGPVAAGVGFLLLVFGVIGARWGYLVLLGLESGRLDPWRFLRVWEGGLSVQGGALLSGLAVWWWCRRRGIAAGLIAEALAPLLPLALVLARLGCFLNGCCRGQGCDAQAWYAVSMPEWGVDPDNHDFLVVTGHAAPAHPAVLYMAAAALPIAALVVLAQRRWGDFRATSRPKPRGFLLMVALMSAARFGYEFVGSANSVRRDWLGLGRLWAENAPPVYSVAQVVSASALVGAALYAGWMVRQGRERLVS